MQATVLLADWAEAINGKLYIQGGGWSRASGVQPLTCAIAIRLSVGWDETNKRHTVVLSLVDADGKAVEIEPGKPVVVESTVEVGRPAGILPGSDLDAALAMRFIGLPLPVGRYRFVLEINGEPLGADIVFDIT